MFILVLFLVFLFYKSSLNLFFISDDFYYLSFHHIKDVLSFKPDFYHYNPVFWAVMWVSRSTFGLNPAFFHLFALLIHLFNIIALYYLGKLILKNSFGAILAAAAFSFYFSNYETVYWVTGLATSLMLFFYLTGFIFFLAVIRHFSVINYLLFLSFFALSLFTLEFAISLPIICFVYWLIFSSNSKNIFDLFKLFTLPALFIIFLVILKLQFDHTSLIVSHPTFSRFFVSTIKSFLYLFVPNPYIIDSSPKIMLAAAFIALSIYLIKNSINNRRHLFLLIWIAITVTTFNLTSVPQARYFSLPSVPSALLIVSILKLNKINRKILYIAFMIFSGILFLQEQKTYWQKASRINQKTLSAIKRLIPSLPTDQTIYFVNLPDSVNGPPWQAYAFRSGLENALLVMNHQKFRQIKYVRTIPLDGKVREDPLIGNRELIKLKESGAIIFVYQPEEEAVTL